MVVRRYDAVMARLRTRGLSVVALAVALALTTAGCSSSKPHPSSTTTLPDGATVMQQSEAAMSTVQTVHFEIDIKGTLAGLPVSKAAGDLKANGDAKGSANITEFGVNVEVAFIITNKTFYLKGVTGGYAPMPLSTASSIIDPSAILDPNRGVVRLMKTATNPKTEGVDQINGKDNYRVSVTPDPQAVASLVPGAGAGTTATLWVDTKTHRVSKGVFTVPGTNGGKAATVTITMTNYDAPVTVNAP